MILLSGFIAGISAGFFGIGGGVMLTPVIRILLKQPAAIALGTTVPTIFPAAFFGLIPKIRTPYFKRNVFIYAAPGTVIGASAGAALTAIIDASWLMIVTAFLMFFAGLRLLKGANSKGESAYLANLFESIGSGVVNFSVGFIAGCFSGLLGIGGGLFLIPGFIILSNLTAHEAAATSLGVILAAAVPSVIIHSKLGHIDWILAGYLSLSVPLGSYLGSKLNEKFTSEVLRKLFGIFLMIAAVYFVGFEVKK